MELLEHGACSDGLGTAEHENTVQELRAEVPPDRELVGLPVRIIGRGNVGDVSFEVADCTRRVAALHLTRAECAERLQVPFSATYKNRSDFIHRRRMPDHKEWAGE